MFDDLIEKGMKLYSKGKLDDALRCFDAIIEKDPDSEWAKIRKANILKDLGRFNEAVTWYNKTDIMKLGRAAAWGYFQKSYAYYMVGNPDKSIACLDVVLDLDPHYKAAWFNKGVTLSTCFDITRAEELRTDAIHCYDKELEVNPENADALYNKGLLLSDMQMLSEALECYNDAIQIRPKFESAYVDKGNMLDSMGKYKEAIACYDKALELDPNNWRALYNKSKVLYFQDRVSESLELLKKSATISSEIPDFDKIKSMLEERLEFNKSIHKTVVDKPEN